MSYTEAVATTWKLSDGTSVSLSDGGVRVSGYSELAAAIRADVHEGPLVFDPLQGVHELDTSSVRDLDARIRYQARRHNSTVTESPDLPERELGDEDEPGTVY